MIQRTTTLSAGHFDPEKQQFKKLVPLIHLRDISNLKCRTSILKFFYATLLLAVIGTTTLALTVFWSKRAT